MGNRAILHAKCHDCSSNLLAEVLEFEERCSATEIDQPLTTEFPTEAEDSDLLETGAE